MLETIGSISPSGFIPCGSSADTVAYLVIRGWLSAGPGGFRLTPAGQQIRAAYRFETLVEAVPSEGAECVDYHFEGLEDAF